MDRILANADGERSQTAQQWRRLVWRWALAALLSGIYVPAFAAEGPPVLTGGVGSDEREQVEARRADFNLRLAFATQKGEYVAGVGVHIDAERDGHYERIYDAESVGPLFYVQLAPGKYRIELAYRGASRVIERQVGTQQKVREIIVRWPSTD